MPIEYIPLISINEVAAIYVALDPHHVLSTKVDTTASAAAPILTQSSQQSVLVLAFTAALSSVFGVRQRF